MAIKDIYKEIENDKSNTPKGKKKVEMDVEEFIDEHKELIKVLREGSREELLAMAEEQEEELEECLKEHGMSQDTEEQD